MATYTKGVLRDFPRVNVPRGYAGNEPQSITKSAPVNSSATIKSGQAIALVSNEWVQATNSHTLSQIYIAYHDSDDTDVVSCGKLLGFSVLGEFEIETPWVNTKGISVGTKLVVNANNDLCAAGNTSGGAAGSVPVGYVSEIRDLGVRGHDSNNPRGGVIGTIPEDSTANGAYGAQLTVTGTPNNSGTLKLVDYTATARTWTINNGSTSTAGGVIGIQNLTATDDIAAQIAKSINATAHAFSAVATGSVVDVWQTVPGAAGISTGSNGTITNVDHLLSMS